METTDLHNEQIDLYLSNRMSDEEAIAFEQKVQEVPGLSEKLAYERMIIGGIQDFRKQQLKNHLASIPVGNQLWYSGFLSQAAKISYGVLIASGVGLGLWSLLDDAPADNLANEVKEESTMEAQRVVEKEERNVISETPEISLPESSVAMSTKTEPVESAIPAIQKRKEEKTTHEVFVPVIEVPDDESLIMEETGFESAALEEMAVGGEVATTLAIPDVLVESDGIQSLRYRYFDGKLNLYGDYSGDEYQILEINSSKGKMMYLFFKESYYALKPVSEVSVLKKITDSGLITELEIIRLNK